MSKKITICALAAFLAGCSSIDNSNVVKTEDYTLIYPSRGGIREIILYQGAKVILSDYQSEKNYLDIVKEADKILSNLR